jgi:deazaflavin-dependent oxidoreductase (nitroreductase family)
MNTAAKTSAITFDDIAALTAEVAAPGGGQGPVANQVNERFIAEFRANKGKIAGELGAAVDLMLLTVTGAKTGKERIIPLAYFEIDGRFVIIASMGGAPTHPAWYHNVKANPRVTVEVGDETFEADAEVFDEGSERDRLFAQQAKAMDNFREYQEKTTRVIPVITLTRR